MQTRFVGYPKAEFIVKHASLQFTPTRGYELVNLVYTLFIWALFLRPPLCKMNKGLRFVDSEFWVKLFVAKSIGNDNEAMMIRDE